MNEFLIISNNSGFLLIEQVKCIPHSLNPHQELDNVLVLCDFAILQSSIHNFINHWVRQSKDFSFFRLKDRLNV